MKNSNLKNALATMKMNKELEIINPETVKGGAKCGTYSNSCGTRTTCIIRFRDVNADIKVV